MLRRRADVLRRLAIHRDNADVAAADCAAVLPAIGTVCTLLADRPAKHDPGVALDDVVIADVGRTALLVQARMSTTVNSCPHGPRRSARRSHQLGAVASSCKLEAFGSGAARRSMRAGFTSVTPSTTLNGFELGAGCAIAVLSGSSGSGRPAFGAAIARWRAAMFVCCSDAIAERLAALQADGMGNGHLDKAADTAPTGDLSVRVLMLVVLAAAQLVWLVPVLWFLSRRA